MKILKFINKDAYYFSISKLIILSLLVNSYCDEGKDNYTAIFPLKTYYPTGYDNNPIQDLINSFNYRKIYLDIEVESGQKIHMFFNNDISTMYTNNTIAYYRNENDKAVSQYTEHCEKICTYNYESNSYKSLSSYNVKFGNLIACEASEKMIFYKDLDQNEKSINEIKFLHVSNDSHICLLGGLIEGNYDYNLLYQVKKLIKSKKYTWSPYFINRNEEKLIIGDIIGNNKLIFYNENIGENYMQFDRQYSSTGTSIFWKIDIGKISIGNYTKEFTNQLFDIDYNSRYISVDEILFNEIKKEYMLNNEICKEVQTFFTLTKTKEYQKTTYKTIYCDKEKYLSLTDNYKKLKPLKLEFSTNFDNIAFTPQDLFLEKDNNVYFFIREHETFYQYYSDIDDNEEKMYYFFSIGTILFEKYVTVFDNEAKILYILKHKNDINNKNKGGENNDREPEKENTTLKIVLICVLVFILCAIIFIIIGKFFGKKIFGKRQKKANELIDDNFDYTPENNNDNNKGVLGVNEEENGGNYGS